MRQLPSLGEDGDRGVSPVSGVILMVAITVILAAVIASFVLGLGDQTNETAPNVNFNGEFNDSNGFILSIDTTGGDGDASDFVLSGDNETSLEGRINISAGESAEFPVGEFYTNNTDEIQVIFRGDNEQVFDTFEVPDNN